MLLGLVVALLVVIIDQASKYWILSSVLGENVLIGYSPFFNLVRAWNTGVSFSMFNDWGWWGIIGLSLLALTIVGFLLHWLYKETNRVVQVALGFIIGGAIGNVIDRVRLGAVFDFLDFHIGDSHWPAFNAADSFICVGAIIIIIYSFLGSSPKTKEGVTK